MQKFFLDGDSLFDDRFNQLTQLPLPIKNDIGYDNNIQDQIQTNEDGIVLYAKQPPISSINGSSFFPNEIVYNKARIGYVEDANGGMYKIKNKSEFNEELSRILKKLKPELREIIIFKHYQELKFKDIAVITNTAESTLKSRFQKALSEIRKELEPV